MKYHSPYDSFWFYGDPRYYMAVQDEKRQIRKESNRLGWIAFLGIGLMMAFSVGGILYYRAFQSYQPSFASFGGVNPIMYYLIDALSRTFGLSIPVFLYFAIRRIPLSRGIPFEKVGALKILVCIFLGSAGCLIANFPASIIVNMEEAFGFSGNIPDMPLSDNPSILALYVLSVVIIPPIVEEMMFRGMILQGLRRFGDGFAVVASAVLFGLYHGNLAQSVFAFLCGLVLGFVVIRTNSLLPSILIHAINNGTAVALELVEKYLGSDALLQIGGIRVVVLLVLGLISFIYLLVREKQFFHSRNSGSPLRFSQKLGAFLSNPGIIVMIIYAAVSSVYYLTAV